MFTSAFRMAMTASFDPRSLSPALWFDAADPATMYDATSGGSLVAADGAVARWEDKSGNSRHATQATSGQLPIRKISVQNGRDCVRFDGVNDSLTHGLSSAVTSLSIFVITKKLSDQSGYRGLLSLGQNGVNGSAIFSRLSTSFWGAYCGYDQPATTAAGISAFRLLSMIDNEVPGGDFYLDGAADGTWSGDTLGQSLRHIGGETGQSSHSDIAEILVYPTALTTDNRKAVERYLSAKWAIALA